jgi:hypothetical protein
MNKTLIIIGIAAVAALNSPWLMEGATNNCAAVERLALRATAKPADRDHKAGMALAEGFFALSDGRIAAHAAAEKLAGIPTPISCLIGYWYGHGQSGGLEK